MWNGKKGMWIFLVCCFIKSIMESFRFVIVFFFGKFCLFCLFVIDESFGVEIKEIFLFIFLESVIIKRKIRNKEEFSFEVYGNEDGERRVK